MLRVSLGVFVLAGVFGRPSPATEPSVRPNVLLIFSDDLRPELGCYGHPTVKTPNIDALAAAGVRFDRAYCQFPLCNPSRSSLLTGRYPTQTGVLGNRDWFGDAHPDYVSLPKLFKQNGYATLRAGKIFHGGIDDTDAWTEGGERRRFGGGFISTVSPIQDPPARQSDSIIVMPGDGENVGDGAVAGRAVNFLRKYQDKPFFLACGFVKPHSPPEAPKKYFDQYAKAEVTLPPDFAPRPTPPAGIPPVSVRKNTDLFIGRDATPEQAKEMTRAYWASLTWMDQNVGRVLAELDRLKLREKTVVVFLGDHGYHLGEKGRWSKAGSLFEVGTRVPLIVAVPGANGNGKSSPRVVEALNLYRTVAGVAGLTVADGVRGRDMGPLLTDPAATWDHPAYSVWAEGGTLNGVAVRTEKYRYAEWDGPTGGPMLFDPAADPHEMKNLAGDPKFADVRKEMSALVRAHRAAR